MESEKTTWRKLRREKEIALTEIARHLGCTSQHLTQWEKKENYHIAEDVLEGYKKYITEH